jgi:hypothetical protein
VIQICLIADASPATSLKVQIQIPLRSPKVGMSFGITSVTKIPVTRPVLPHVFLKLCNPRFTESFGTLTFIGGCGIYQELQIKLDQNVGKDLFLNEELQVSF